ncbi:MAG: SpoIIE family protein phosphatase, partial [Sinobacterium sp.]|nr:SpoIIE family protein phosphatase [Sinobacterium sp.]
ALLIIFIALLVKRLTQPLSLLTKTVESFGQGNLNVTLPNIQSNTETNTLALAFKGMQVSLTEYIGRLKTETANINRLEGELSAATQIQMEMLPGNGLAKLQFSSLSLWAHVIPAKSVGGDLYHYRINENKLTFIVGDVSDKGVPAALFMATTVSLFKQYSQQRKSPAQILTRLNDALEEHNDACMFVTACVGELNLGSGELIYSSAGHSPPLLKSELKLLELTQDTGPALGLVAGASYPTNNITMPAKSQLIIYTDGVDEAFNTQKEMYGLDRLLMHLNHLEVSSTQEIGESIFSSVATFSGEQDQSDDITVMVLEFKPAFRFLIHSASVSSEPMHLSVPAHTSSMPLILNAFDDYLKHQLDSAFDLGTAQLVIEEAFVNAVNHGKLSLNTVEFHFVVHEGHLLVEMIDSGTAFNPFEQCPEPELGLEIDEVEIGGLGVHLIKSMSLEHEYQRLRGKNHICLLISCEISI